MIGKQLIQRPGVRRGLEHRKIADVLAGQNIFEIDEFLGPLLHRAGELDGLAADLPEQPFAVGAILQIQIAEVEERLQLLPVLQRVVVVLAEVLRD